MLLPADERVKCNNMASSLQQNVAISRFAGDDECAMKIATPLG